VSGEDEDGGSETVVSLEKRMTTTRSAGDAENTDDAQEQDVQHQALAIQRKTLCVYVITPIVLGIYTCFTGWMAVSNNKAATAAADAAMSASKANRLNVRTFRASQRAYVGLSKITADWDHGQITLLFENIGKVPASRVHGTARQRRQAAGSDGVTETQQTFGGGRAELFPGMFPDAVVVQLEGYDPSSEKTAIAAGTESVMISGDVEYDDGFHTTQRYDFAFRSTSVGVDGWTAVPIIKFEDMQKYGAEAGMPGRP
jgi:hypothetical protein